MTNILYVGDNRNRQNWGCRATSRALFELISANNTVQDTIFGDKIGWSPNSAVPITRLIPAKLSAPLYKRRNQSFFYYLINFIEHSLGGSPDYVDINLDKAVANFFRLSESSKDIADIHKSLLRCDQVVINGEGDMIFQIPHRRPLLFFLLIIELCEQLGKPVHYVNGNMSDGPKSPRDPEIFSRSIRQLRKCKTVFCRDPDSFELVSPYLSGVECDYVPDALFSWTRYSQSEGLLSLPANSDILIGHPECNDQFGRYDFTSPYICIGGSSSAAWDQSKSFSHYVDLVEKFKLLGLQIYLVQACWGDRFLLDVGKSLNVPVIPVQTPIIGGMSILANASLFVSGRYHPSILASLGGTPCIFMGSNSMKMTSLQKTLNYESIVEYPVHPSNFELEDMLQRAEHLISSGDFLRNRIRATAISNSLKARRMSCL